MASYRFVARRKVIPNLLDRTAFRAWRELRPEAKEAHSIEVLQDEGKSIVLRFNGVSPEGTAIIAKIRPAGDLDFERRIYEEVLPELPIRTPRYYGFVTERESQSDWLFLEDAGNQRYSPLFEPHRVLAGQWLALLHTHVPSTAPESFLPDRGAANHLQILRKARENILNNLSNPALDERKLPVLMDILSHFDLLESQWSVLTKACEPIPQGLVHSDFKKGNIRIENHAERSAMIVCDWESVGWGVPLVDLAQSLGADTSLSANPALGPYWEIARDRWPQCDLHAIEYLANLGTIWRSIRGISWGAVCLSYRWVEDAVAEMESYLPILSEAMKKTGWYVSL